MELYQQLIFEYFSARAAALSAEEAAEIAQGQSYRALLKIKAILEDSTLDDPTCFQKIEEIVNVFEAFGAPIAQRHDFG